MYEGVSMIFSHRFVARLQRARNSQARVSYVICSLSLSLVQYYRNSYQRCLKIRKIYIQHYYQVTNQVSFSRFFSAYECGIAYVSDLFSTYGTNALISNHLEIPIFVINRLLAYYHT